MISTRWCVECYAEGKAMASSAARVRECPVIVGFSICIRPWVRCALFRGRARYAAEGLVSATN